MKMRFPRRKAGKAGGPPPAGLPERLPMTGLPGPGGPLWLTGACCCPARPVVRVLVPPAPAGQHSVDLMLCGHHYRTSCAALAAVGAVIMDDRRSGGTIVTEYELGDSVPSDATPRR